MCKIILQKTNGKDVLGREIENIIHKELKRYVIYFVKDDYLNIAFHSISNELNPDDAYFRIASEIDYYSIRLVNEKKNSFVREFLGNALFNYQIGNKNTAMEILNQLKIKLKDITEKEAYRTYLTSSIAVFILYIIVSNCVISNFILSNFKIMNYSIILGGIGGFAYQLKALEETYKPKSSAYGYISGITKMLFSLISGLLIYLVIKSNIIMGNFSENNYAILVIAFVAGFNHEWVVEYLIKTILSKVGKKNNEKEDML